MWTPSWLIHDIIHAVCVCVCVGSPYAASYAHLAHMPSAFSMLGAQSPFFPGAAPLPFGGLGSLGEGLGGANPLGSPGSLAAAALGHTGGINPAASEEML